MVDFLIRFEEVDWAVCAGVHDEQLILSVRAAVADAQAGDDAAQGRQRHGPGRRPRPPGRRHDLAAQHGAQRRRGGAGGVAAAAAEGAGHRRVPRPAAGAAPGDAAEPAGVDPPENAPRIEGSLMSPANPAGTSSLSVRRLPPPRGGSPALGVLFTLSFLLDTSSSLAGGRAASSSLVLLRRPRAPCRGRTTAAAGKVLRRRRPRRRTRSPSSRSKASSWRGPQLRPPADRDGRGRSGRQGGRRPHQQPRRQHHRQRRPAPPAGRAPRRQHRQGDRAKKRWSCRWAAWRRPAGTTSPCPARPILAERTTITGSIGVYASLPQRPRAGRKIRRQDS